MTVGAITTRNGAYVGGPRSWWPGSLVAAPGLSSLKRCEIPIEENKVRKVR